VVGGTTSVELHDLRPAGVAMLGLAFILPALPGHPGLPCPLRTLTGVPCPLCGMTTSVEDTVHSHLDGAFVANPVGIAAVAVACVLPFVHRQSVRVSRFAIGGLLGAMWLFELHRFGFI
jgi:hypothetical protein